jgi:hypothetical protein
MAKIKNIPKALAVIGIMFKEIDSLTDSLNIIKKRFGEIRNEVEYDFNFTDYYEQEMGSCLKKRLFIFNLIDREDLAEIKHFTNKIEDEMSKSENRIINIDPGYMTLHNVILASAKEMPHKIYIGKGMFGDVVLEYHSGSYQHSTHTFPDYKSDFIKKFLTEVRNKNKKDLQ